MKTRVITGIILAVVFVPLFVLGGLVLNITLALLTLMATYELVKLYNSQESLPKWIWGLQILLGVGLYVTVSGYFVGDMALEYVFLVIVLSYQLMVCRLVVMCLMRKVI